MWKANEVARTVKSLVVDLPSRLVTSFIPPSYLGTILILTLSEHLECRFLKSHKRNGVNQCYDQIKSLAVGMRGDIQRTLMWL